MRRTSFLHSASLLRAGAALLLCLAMPVAHLRADSPKKPLFSSDLSGGDMQFFSSAMQQGTLQASLGQLAVARAQSSEVKTFGQTLMREQALQNEQVRLLAIKKGFTLPENGNTNKNPIADKLSKLQGLKFDKAYMEEMYLQQQSYVTIFEQASQSRDPDIKAFATATLPTLRQHLAFLKGTTATAPPMQSATPKFRGDVGSPAAVGSPPAN